MFLKQVIIQNKNSIIRDIHFHKGINLIVDETPVGSSQQATGNNVGKTTVLRLVDYCFGADGKNIYQDTEFNKQPNTTIENFLPRALRASIISSAFKMGFTSNLSPLILSNMMR